MSAFNQLPASVKVAGKTVFVESVAGLESYGEYDRETCAIKIRSGLPHGVAMDTLRHEMFHAGLHLSGIHYIIPSEELEESIVRCWENIIAPAISDLSPAYHP